MDLQKIIGMLLSSVVVALAQEGVEAGEEGAAPQQGGGLSREVVEHLLSVVSPSCREEMEEALQEQTELSSGCKQEIQSALADRAQAAGGAGPPGGPPPAPPAPTEWGPIVVVLLFVALLVGGLIAFSFHAHEQRQKFLKANPSKDRSKKGKKWHKKQKEKGKM
jgi:hypothetical protein